MGWSLSGILGAAMVGSGGAAERVFGDEHKSEMAQANAKDLATFNADLQFDRQQRVEEGRTKRAADLEIQNRESDAANFEEANTYALRAKDAVDEKGEAYPGAGAKQGSVEYYDAKADFLDRSGRSDLAKPIRAEADQVRKDDTTDAANAARAAGHTGGSRSGGGGKGSEPSVIDIDAQLANIAKMGVSTKDGEAKLDPGAYAIANSFYSVSLANTNDQKKALDATRTLMLRTFEYSQDHGVSLRDASKSVIGNITTNQSSKSETVRAKRAKDILTYPEEAPANNNNVTTENNIAYLENQGRGQVPQAAPNVPTTGRYVQGRGTKRWIPDAQGGLLGRDSQTQIPDEDATGD